ncbi:hypothetical protein M885DRAFT_22118 [Pelagophyceae sp. CCMP2097]|nr:hypothetical protein M885DRAFT_22118 [Pelagophyceae sp. CCMP2097]
MADEAPPALRPADVVAPVLHFVNVSSKPLALYAYADASSPACTAERLMPARVVRCERLAVVEGVLWVEVAGYEDALWLPYDAEALRDRETGPHKAFYRAAHHDVPLYCGPSRTAALCGDVVAKYESARFDLTKLVGHELWGRIDDRVSDVSAGERWACISDRVEDHRDFLQLEPFQLTGYFVNIFAAHHNGQLPAREAPSLDATKVCGVPDWIAFKAGAVALVPIATKRSKSGINETSLKHSPVGLLWARIRVVHKGSTLECWTIEANANTGIVRRPLS